MVADFQREQSARAWEKQSSFLLQEGRLRGGEGEVGLGKT
jgi:hypothetical protein